MEDRNCHEKFVSLSNRKSQRNSPHSPSLPSPFSLDPLQFSMEITECGRANAERMDLIH